MFFNKLRYYIAIALPLVGFMGACTAPASDVYDLRCENLYNPLSIDSDAPHLSWKLQRGVNGREQLAYQILAATDSILLDENSADLWNSGKVESSASVMVPYGGKPVTTNSLCYWKVRVWDNSGEPSPWSHTACFGAPLHEADLQAAAYIGFPKEAGNPSSPILRTKVDWDGEGRAILYVNSLGYHEAYINGTKVGRQVLAPAVSQFNKRSLYLAYDVTPLLDEGSNDVVLWLGQGWYKPGMPGVVYEGPLVKARLDVFTASGRRNILMTDSRWQAAQSGRTGLGNARYLNFGGEAVDASAEPTDMKPATLDGLTWLPVATVEVPAHAVSPQMCEPNYIITKIPAKSVKAAGDSCWIIDMGTTLTGWADIRFPKLQKGQRIRLFYSDHFNDKGELGNMGHYDIYTASGKANEHFCSRFEYHAFQYIRISGLEQAPAVKDVTGLQIRTGYDDAATFECSDPDMNAIHGMVRHALHNLSLGGDLVDCPHIERLGYGGDGNASTETAQTMFNLAPTYANWMQAWADCIRDDGGMPHTAPNPYPAGGGPYWCGFIITASWQTYVNYGDARLLERYYPLMQRWLGYVDTYTVDSLLTRWPDTDYRNWYLGDWACPTGVDQTNPRSIDLVDNSFICYCYDRMQKIATLLGKNDDAKRYADIAGYRKAAVQRHFYNADSAIYATGSQIDLAYPMLAGITADSLKGEVTKNLFYETGAKRKGHIACGLVGIPVITEWAVANRYPDFIYNMLKKRDYPGYLYMLDNGATSTWEHWNGERSRIHNCYNGIGSWFYQAIGGIRTDENNPGYRTIRLDPQIPSSIKWAKTTKDTPYGKLIFNWSKENGIYTMDITVPVGSTAVIAWPCIAESAVLNGKEIERSEQITVKSGTWQVKLKIEN